MQEFTGPPLLTQGGWILRMEGIMAFKISAITQDFQDVFPKELPKGLPPKRDIDHRIDIERGAAPPSKKAYRMSPRELDELKKQSAELKGQGFIRASTSPERMATGGHVVLPAPPRATLHIEMRHFMILLLQCRCDL
jgi:hypothetical protein